MDIIIEDLHDKLEEHNIMQRVLSATCKIADLDKKLVLSSDRTYPVKLARIVSNNIMLNEFDINKARVGPFHNRDRSSCYYYQKIHNEQKIYWKDYERLYDKVHEEVTNGAKFSKITRNEINHILRVNKIVDDKVPTHMIRCRIGNKSFTILARHQILFDKLDEIHKAFNKFKIIITYKNL
tara:strand:+ start:347 stop:889 length:543 start_codon:yes stop_codon:yes gene_type:complete